MILIPIRFILVLGEATSAFEAATSDAASLAGEVTSFSGDATSLAAGVIETVESDGGSIFTVITSLGAAGKANSFAGHELTIASLAIHGTSTSSGGSSTPSSTSPASSNGASSRSLSSLFFSCCC
ncbi:hypothetical protein BT96DRAFT_1017828 [Gymnopus androsaceus JB14]|uniref:Secreted protein n=1 Tax=Gymnopus androsaceus JB14 TaxID=1447944 RepID=A0A6A4HVS9_9AGAR|nr:hypothetical protein BT96DRAFT_1017828 [Gymnopus androsaceus JB14]